MLKRQQQRFSYLFYIKIDSIIFKYQKIQLTFSSSQYYPIYFNLISANYPQPSFRSLTALFEGLHQTFLASNSQSNPRYILGVIKNILIMDTLPIIQPDIQELELEASFSSSSGSSSSGDLLDMSDIVALCDQDVRLTTGEIKIILKSLCNRIFQIQLGQNIKDANLRMSGSFSQDKNKHNYGQSQPKKDNKQDNKTEKSGQAQEENEFNLNIHEKTMSELENKRKQSKSSKRQKTKKADGLEQQQEVKIKKRMSQRPIKQKINSISQKTNASLEKRLKQIQEQLEKIKNMMEVKNQHNNVLITSTQQLLKQMTPQIFSSQIQNQSKFSHLLANSPQLSKYSIAEVENGLQIQYEGNQYQENTLELKEFTEIKILKIAQKNIQIGLINQHLEEIERMKESPISLLFSGKNQASQGFNIGDTIKLRLQEEDGKLKKVQWFVNDEKGASVSLAQEERIPIKNCGYCIIFTNPGDKVLIR